MKAIVITAHGNPEVLALTELRDPVPRAGDVLIRVRAFGLNHAETYMRSGAWGKVAQVPGIECAGTVQADPGGRLAAGTPVIAILGGMGRWLTSIRSLTCPPASSSASTAARLCSEPKTSRSPSNPAHGRGSSATGPGRGVVRITDSAPRTCVNRLPLIAGAQPAGADPAD
jgi:hypothetical protein